MPLSSTRAPSTVQPVSTPTAARGSISTGRLGDGDGEGTEEHDGDEGYLGVASVGATVDGGGLTTGAGARQRGRWRAVEV